MCLQERNRVVAPSLDLLLPSGGHKVGWITPTVVVESEEVDSLIVCTAIHILGSLQTVVVDVGGGVADRDGTVLPVANVLLHVTGDSFDPWSRDTGWDIVDDLVSREEE